MLGQHVLFPLVKKLVITRSVNNTSKKSAIAGFFHVAFASGSPFPFLPISLLGRAR